MRAQVSYEPQVVLAGLDVTRIQTTFESNWRLTPEMIRRTFRGRRHKNCTACILILNYPGNPNGLTYSSLELKALAQVFREYGVIVVSDEIYGHLHYGNRHTSLARHYPEGARYIL